MGILILSGWTITSDEKLKKIVLLHRFSFKKKTTQKRYSCQYLYICYFMIIVYHMTFNERGSYIYKKEFW